MLTPAELPAGNLPGAIIGDLIRPARTLAFPDQTLREVAVAFARNRDTCAPVVSRSQPGTLAGIITLNQLLEARRRDDQEEYDRELTLRLRPRIRRSSRGGGSADLTCTRPPGL